MAKSPKHVSLEELLHHKKKLVQIQARTIHEILTTNGTSAEEVKNLTLESLVTHPHRIIRKLGGILADDMIQLEIEK